MGKIKVNKTDCNNFGCFLVSNIKYNNGHLETKNIYGIIQDLDTLIEMEREKEKT